MDRAGKETHAEQILPEHLVENIVARIPFPSIINARQLSKEWKSKFSSVARQSLLTWPQYFARLSMLRGRYEVVILDSDLDFVKRIPLDNAVYAEDRLFACDASCGSLLVAVHGAFRPSAGTRLKLSYYSISNTEWPDMEWASREATVINILTRQSKTVICPITRPITLLGVLLVPIGTDHYDLIIWYRDRGTGLYSIVYNSSSGSWETEYECICKFMSGSVYKDGTWYYVHHSGGDPVNFVCLHVSSADTKTPITVEGKLPGIRARYLLCICGSDVMAIVIDSRELIVLLFDTESSTLVEVSRTPVSKEDWPKLDRGIISQISSSNRIYLDLFFHGTDALAHLLYVYDVNTKTWSRSSIPTEFRLDGKYRLAGGSESYGPFVLELGLNPLVVP